MTWIVHVTTVSSVGRSTRANHPFIGRYLLTASGTIAVPVRELGVRCIAASRGALETRVLTEAGVVAGARQLARVGCQAVVATDLQLAVLDVELCHELLEHVVGLGHQLLGLLLGHRLEQENVWSFEVRE